MNTANNAGGSPLLLNGREVLITDTALQLRDRPWWKSPLGIVGHVYLLAVGVYLLILLWAWGAGFPFVARLFLSLILILFWIAVLLPSVSVTTLVQIADGVVLVRGKEFCERGALAFERGFGWEGFTVFAVDTQRQGRRRSVYGSLNPFTVQPLMEAVFRFWSLESASQTGDWPPPPRREGH